MNEEGIETETISLQAKNSSGEQTLWIDKFDDGTYKFTLTGYYRDKDIQIDFDYLEADEFREFIAKLYKLSKKIVKEKQNV